MDKKFRFCIIPCKTLIGVTPVRQFVQTERGWVCGFVPIALTGARLALSMHWSRVIQDALAVPRYVNRLSVPNSRQPRTLTSRNNRVYRLGKLRGCCAVVLLLLSDVATAGNLGEGTVVTTATATESAEVTPPDFDLLSFHRENYFITGFTGSTEVKFQVSAKYDLWPNLGQHGFYFAFTELSLWNAYRKSSPFVELNYNPELFYVYFHHPGRYFPTPGCALFHERVGIEHESNGESAARSRGWNRAYIESRFACYTEQRQYAIVTLKAWAPPIGIADNPRIAHYLGYGQLSVSLGIEEEQRWYGNADCTLAVRKSRDFDPGHGSIEFDSRWRPRFLEYSRFTPYLFGQFFTGYGETLLSYDAIETKFRVGLGFSDRRTRTE